MQGHLLTEFVVIFGLTIAVLFICYRFRIPTLVGFLISGMLAGPYGLGLVQLSTEVDTLSEIGVVMLLFTIGIEFSLSNLVSIKRYVLVGGSAQVFITIATVTIAGIYYGLPASQSVFMGFLLSLSSTAIVLKILQQRDEIGSPHGRAGLAILIFQDMIVVPMMLVVPILAGVGTNITGEVAILLLKGAGIVLLTFVSANWIMPKLLFQVARMRSPEIFLITIIVICFSVAWFTSSLGLSLSLGAFLAGLIISESEYSHQALSTIMPFRDVFTSLFFISIGMLLNVQYVFHHPVPVLLVAVAVLFGKAILSGFASFLLGFPLRTVILVALSLAQVGEFAFVLSKVGLTAGLLTPDIYQVFLGVSILTMAVSPYLIPFSHRLADNAMNWPLPHWLLQGFARTQPAELRKPVGVELNDHLIIIGMGIGGKHVARAAKAAGIPYIILEMNPETVRREKRKGENILYGDATQEAILNHVKIKSARMAVVVITDPVATRGIVSIARRMNPALHLIVRTHYVRETKPLYKLGASQVITEEFETSIEIFTAVLAKYLVPRNEIDNFINHVRTETTMLRTTEKTILSINDLRSHIADVSIEIFSVPPGSVLMGKTIQDSGLRQDYEINLLAIVRNGTAFTNPSRDMMFQPADKLVVFGKNSAVSEFARVLVR